MSVNVEELVLGANSDGLRDAADDYDRLGDRADRAEGQVDRSSRGMDNSISRMGRNAVRALSGMVAGYASLQGAQAALSQARSFDVAFSETSTLIEGTTAELAALEAGSKSLADLYGTTATQQVQAYYQAISAGADGVAGATDILNSANRLAIGGITDVSTGVDALTTAVNAYGPSVITAGEASDAMFVAMRAGKTTIGELSASLGNIVPIAASAGIQFDEVVGGIAALTTQGLGTAAATTQLRQVIAGVIRPTQEAKEAAAALNLEFDAQALASKGLAGFLADVVEKTGGSTDEMSKLFGSVEALGAALAFAGGGGVAFNDIMEDMGSKLGATDAAVVKIEQSLSKRLDVSLNRLSAVGLEFGQVLLEVAVPALEATVDVVQLLAENGEVLTPIILTTAAAMTAMAVAGSATAAGMLTATLAATRYVAVAAILTPQIGLMASAQIVMTGATTALTAAVSLLVSPLGLVVVGVAAASAAMLLLRDDTDLATLAADSQSKALGSLDEALISVNTSTAAGSSNARQITIDHYNAALAVSEHAEQMARLVLEQFRASEETWNPFDGPGLSKLREARDNLHAANAATATLRDRMAEFGATTNDAGEIIDENTGRIIRTSSEIQALHAQQLQFMGEDRARSAEAQAEATAILVKYQEQAEMQRLVNTYGLDSIEVAEERRERERAIVSEQLSGLDVAESLTQEILSAVDATYDNEIATAAWESRMSGVVAQVNAIGAALNEFSNSAINTAANNAEIAALEAGASVQEASHARTIEQIKLETDARVQSTNNIVEQMAIRAAAAQEIAEVESNAALSAARAAASERDTMGGSGGSAPRASENQKELNELQRAGDAIIENLRSEQEKYNEALAQADRLLAAGILNTELYEQHVTQLSQELADAQFAPMIDGLSKISDGMIDAIANGDNLLQSFTNMLAQMALEAIKADIGSLISSAFGGAGGGSTAGVLGLLGGARANGGPVKAGVPYWVNENTRNSEIHVPSESGGILNVPQAQEALMKTMSGGMNSKTNVSNNIRNIVVQDKSLVGDYLSTPEGEEVVNNIIDARGR